jgi:uncharacterized protein
MKIYVERIPEEGLLLEGEEPPQIIDIEESQEKFKENILVEIRAYKVSGNLIVVGSLSTHVQLICSRCLEQFSYLIDDKHFSYDCEILGRDIIDLTDPIREDMIIGLPIRPLCREDCKGLCSQCAQNLNLGECGCQKSSESGGPFSVLGDYF